MGIGVVCGLQGQTGFIHSTVFSVYSTASSNTGEARLTASFCQPMALQIKAQNKCVAYLLTLYNNISTIQQLSSEHCSLHLLQRYHKDLKNRTFKCFDVRDCLSGDCSGWVYI